MMWAIVNVETEELLAMVKKDENLGIIILDEISNEMSYEEAENIEMIKINKKSKYWKQYEERKEYFESLLKKYDEMFPEE